MNNNLHDIVKEKNIHPRSYTRNKKVYIIEDDNKKYVVKLNTNNYDIYKYLSSREFYHYPENYNLENDNYDLSLYIDNTITSSKQKIDDYIELLGKLHHKTAYYRQIDLDEIKEEFEKLKKQIIETREYYEKMNDLIDHETFLSPSMYLLVRNISLFYRLLDYAINTLNTWYIKIQDDKKIEVALLHNNIDLSHLIINNDKYLISWDNACFDEPINDLEKLIRRYFGEISLQEILGRYQKHHKLTDMQRELLLIRLSIPNIIKLTNDTYHDTININSEIMLLRRVYDYIITIKK